MRKSLVVKLVLVNSVLVLSGCARTCVQDDKKEEREPGAAPRRTCTGGSSGHVGGGHYVGGWGLGPRVGTSQAGRGLGTTSHVSRGGFGSTGSAAGS